MGDFGTLQYDVPGMAPVKKWAQQGNATLPERLLARIVLFVT